MSGRSVWWMPVCAVLVLASGCLDFDDAQRRFCDGGSSTACPPRVVTAALADGVVGTAYSESLTAQSGALPHAWSLSSGSLPAGLTLSATGQIGGTPTAEGHSAFDVAVADAEGRGAPASLTIDVYRVPAITSTVLTVATEGVTYMRGPGVPEQIVATGGKAPLSYTAVGLPGGIVIGAGTGILSGIPAQFTGGPHPVTFTVSDASGRTASLTLNLQVNPATPIQWGGTSGIEPASSPITDTLTVFTRDSSGNARPNVAVRIRKNGVEFAPVKEQVTDALGKTVFTGLGLNGTTDTVDVTASGPDVASTSWQRVNAALVTVSLESYRLPGFQSDTNAEIDPVTGKLVILGGNCGDGVVRLSDPATGTWSEDVVPGLTTSPPARRDSATAYAGGSHFLFGGTSCSTGARLNDLWAYNASARSWTRVNASGTVPSPRSGMAMVAVGSQLVLFAGEVDSTVYVYDVNTTTWSSRTPAGTAPSTLWFGAQAVAIGSSMWMCAGLECWSYSVPGNAWTPQPSLPEYRQTFGMAATASGQLYIFGGYVDTGPRNDVLTLTGGAWTPATNINPPSARERMVFELDPATGHFLMLGGSDATFTSLDDLWSYNPATGTWTQRSPGSQAPGFTLTGTITGGAITTNPIRSRAYVQVTGRSGFVNRPLVFLENGTGTYTVSGIPAGDTIALTALNENNDNPFGPSREWSFIDYGVIKTGVNANLTQDVVFPPGPLTSQLLTINGSFSPPSGWGGGWFSQVYSRLHRSGFSTLQYAPNGTGTGKAYDSSTTSFRSDYFPPPAGTEEVQFAFGSSRISRACEDSNRYLFGVVPGVLAPLSLVAGPRSPSPGLNGCTAVGAGLEPDPFTNLVNGTSPSTGGVVATDVSGDGLADVVFVDGNRVAIEVGGQYQGFFPDPLKSTEVSLVGTGTELAVADFDRNGKPDLAVAIPSANAVAVSLQSAAGTFGTPMSVNAGCNVTALVVGDVNGDLIPDLVTTGTSPSNLLTLMAGRGDGTFLAPVPVLSPAQPFTALATADLNRDAHADIVYGQTGGLGFLRGAATGLVGWGNLTGTGTPAVVSSGDLDGDGVVDLVAADQSPNNIQVWLNATAAGSTTLSLSARAPVSLSGAVYPGCLGVAELTGDARQDIVVAHAGGGVIVLQGTGGGALAAFTTSPITSAPRSMGLGDLNADGYPDAAFGEPGVSTSSGAVEVFVNRRPIPGGTDRYSFTAPANTKVVRITRSAATNDVYGDFSTMGTDLDIFVRGAAGVITVDVPALSTLKPGRAAPVGQRVQWTPNLWISANPAYTFDRWEYARNQPDSITISYGIRYIRSP